MDAEYEKETVEEYMKSVVERLDGAARELVIYKYSIKPVLNETYNDAFIAATDELIRHIRYYTENYAY